MVGILFLLLFTFPLVESVKKGLILTLYEILGSIVVNIMIIGNVLWIWLITFSESSVEFTETYIRKTGALGIKTNISWSDNISIFKIGARINIQSPTKKIKINTNYYREPDKLIEYLEDHCDNLKGFTSRENL
jgi:hypothetical protein